VINQLRRPAAAAADRVPIWWGRNLFVSSFSNAGIV
jgi:hypothetical protein